MPKEQDMNNLRLCLDEYRANHVYIRLVGSCGGIMKVDEKLSKKKTLDFRRDEMGLYMLINDAEVFHFPLKDYSKGFSLQYLRFRKVRCGNKMIDQELVAATGIDPYDSSLPEPKTSVLRTVLDDHLMEIGFKGRINIKFHSWWIESHWKYWAVAGKK